MQRPDQVPQYGPEEETRRWVSQGAVLACSRVQHVLLRCKAVDAGADAAQAAVLGLPKLCMCNTTSGSNQLNS